MPLLVLLLEVAVVQPLEAGAVACFVASHLVNGVVNRVKVEFLGALGDLQLVLASAGFGEHTFLKVGLGVPNNLTEQFGKLRSMVSLFVSVLTERSSYLRIALTVSLTSHSQVLANLGALTHKVGAQTVVDNRILFILGYTYHMFTGENETFALVGHFPSYDLFALRATLGCLRTLVDITTDGANEFLFHTVDI